MGFPGVSAGKKSSCHAGDLGSIPGLGKSPGKGKGYAFQYSGLENSMGYTVHGVTKSQTQLSNFHFTYDVRKFLNFILISSMGCGLQGARWSRWQTGSDWEVGRELSLHWASLVRSCHHHHLLLCPSFSVSLALLPPRWPSFLILATVLLSTTHEGFAFGSQCQL